ncbi:MAG: SIMPL domain-containing protein [Bacteroidota bacterium]
MPNRILNLIIIVSLFLPISLFGQAAGNAVRAESTGNAAYFQGYQQRSLNNRVELPQVQMTHNPNEISIRVNALFNAKASSYVGVFAMTQVGETIEETDKLMNEKIDAIKAGAKALNDDNLEIYVDMISLVPVYEYESTKKIFSKKTYTEVPKGFEMKKNLHIRYTDPEALDKIITICAKNEIYDLVKVDYYVDNVEEIYAKMVKQASEFIQKKVDFYKSNGIDLADKKRKLSEGRKAYFPIERYSSYQAYSNYSLEARKKGEVVKRAVKSTAQYYGPISSRYYDIVNNPEIVEPVIQYTYSLAISFDMTEKPEQPKPQVITKTKTRKEVHLILPNGNVKQIIFDEDNN